MRKRKPSNGNGLTVKQKAFVSHYIETLNATEAARRAGYRGSDNVLSVTGYDNLRKPKIREAIDQVLEERLMSPLEVLTRLSQIVEGDIGSLMTDGPPYHLDMRKIKANGHLVSSLKRDLTGRVNVQMHNKLRAIELMGKYHDLFSEKVKHEGNVNLIWDLEVPPLPKT